ncbi:hypothetical protein [Citrobacter farmeri]|uniref:hypothetical protein n=1 Tax=Citrobacter farmeri TaxID=67824 RepID=UPI0018FF626F|nr:hypothetical protein [Citrobacter farmeri]MBJ9134427.1 hypothetical protein [Citrobacter farmeri]
MDSMNDEKKDYQSADQAVADITAILSGNDVQKSTPNKEKAKVAQTEEAPEESDEVEDTESEHDDVEEEVEETEEEESTADDEETDDEPEVQDVEDDDESEVSVMIDGEKTKVKLGDLKSGFMRQQDYTRKTQELSKTRKELESELRTSIERSEAVQFNAINKMQQFQDVVEQFGGWNNLKANVSPAEAEQFEAQYKAVQQEYHMANSIIEQSREAFRKNSIEAINGIFKELGNTRSDFKGDSTIQEMDSYLKSKGFTQDMVMSMTDIGAWEIIMDAVAYNKVKTKAKTAETTITKKAKSLPKNQKVSSESKKDKDYKTNLKRMQSENPEEARAAGAALIRNLL